MHAAAAAAKLVRRNLGLGAWADIQKCDVTQFHHFQVLHLDERFNIVAIWD